MAVPVDKGGPVVAEGEEAVVEGLGESFKLAEVDGGVVVELRQIVRLVGKELGGESVQGGACAAELGEVGVEFVDGSDGHVLGLALVGGGEVVIGGAADEALVIPPSGVGGHGLGGEPEHRGKE
jgi:hypothetical protein